MILKFFNKEEQLNDKSNLLNVACLMIHAAKIDENYTDKEKKIIKNTLTKLDSKNENIDKVILEAEIKESDSNHIQDFTKNIKAMDKENKIEIIKNIWSIVLSDGKVIAKGTPSELVKNPNAQTAYFGDSFKFN